jgi:phosphate starvation-inducible PhoH-like protein
VPDPATHRITLASESDLLSLLGRNDENLRLLESELDLRVVARGVEVTLKGDARHVARGARVLEELRARVEAGLSVQAADVRAALRVLAEDETADLRAIFLDAIPVPSRKRQITPKTLNQKRYVDAIRSYDVVIGIGPAGTGKSYLAMAMAVAALTRREVSRIILTRPAVEAGERLGFLPGDMYEKVHPYLRPLYDALYDMLEPDRVATMTERGAIEIAPLAYMRGRTLNDAFIVLDEAQNTTSEQMKMFLTRLGFNSRMVITGDITQVDLPSTRTSGLIEIQAVLKHVAGIAFVYFTEKDVVRHELVSEIVKAYDEWAQERGDARDRG